MHGIPGLGVIAAGAAAAVACGPGDPAATTPSEPAPITRAAEPDDAGVARAPGDAAARAPGDAGLVIVVPQPPPAPPPPFVSEQALARTAGELPELDRAVVVNFCIDRTGKLSSIQVPEDLAQAVSLDVRRALLAWRFEPYQRNGAAIAVCSAVAIPAHAQVTDLPPDPSLPDALDRAAIVDGMAPVNRDVMSCGRRHGARGTVKVKVTIDGEGQVASVSADVSDELELCLTKAIERARFPRSKHGVTVGYPFTFATSAAGQPAPDRAMLEVITEPWCWVYVDGKRLAETPARLELAPGRHRVVLMNPDEGIDETFRIDLEPGETHRLEPDLTRRRP